MTMTMTKRPTAFFTLQAVTALSSTALFGIAGYLSAQADVVDQQEAQTQTEQAALVSQAVAQQVAEVTATQQAQVDEAMTNLESLRQEYEAALEEARRAATARATRTPSPSPSPASTPAPSPPPAPSAAPAPAPAPAPVDGNSGGS